MVTIVRPEVDLICGADNHLGETPWWSVREQALYWVNIEAEPQVWRWGAATQKAEHRTVHARVGGIVEKTGGGLLLALADGLYDFDFDSGGLSLRLAAQSPDLFSLHETACDRDGRLWVGSYDHTISVENLHPARGFLHRLDGNELVRVVSGVSCSNGLAISPDGRTLYHIAAPGEDLMAWDLGARGELANPRAFANLPLEQGVLDGATVDSEGGYWVAATFGSAIHRYSADGELDTILELPFSNPTKMAFGGSDLDRLFITTTKLSFDAEPAGLPMLGGVYATTVGVRGVPETLFKG